MRVPTTCSTRKAGPARGFTLTELLVVIAIIGILSGLVYGTVTKAIERAKIHATRALVHAIGTGLHMFKTDFGHLPYDASGEITNDPEFIRLWLLGIDNHGDPDGNTNPQNSRQVRANQYWIDPYVDVKMEKNVIADYHYQTDDEPISWSESLDYVLVDAWDQRIYFETYDPTQPQYQHRPIHKTDKWDVWSRGPDGVGTPDDEASVAASMRRFHGDYEKRLDDYNTLEEDHQRVNRDNIGNWQ